MRTTANKYPAPCAICGATVETGEGLAVATVEGRTRTARGWSPRYVWRVEHRPAQWVGAPTSGHWQGGCPHTK